MEAMCNECKGLFTMSNDEVEFYQGLDGPGMTDFARSTICWFCAGEKKADRITVAGALACHVRHISGKLLSKDVSRETNEKN